MEKLEIKEGVAVRTTADVALTKEDVLAIKQDLENQIANCEAQLVVNQTNLEAAKVKLAECEAICDELGYNE